jgi:glycosyltransferase involved in cell wall biosynthesis
LKDWYGYDPALINDDVVVLDDSGLDFAQSCYMFIEWLIKNQPKVLIPVSSKIAVSSIPWVPLTCHVVSRCVDITPYVMKLVTANYRYVSKVIYTSPRQAHELIQKHQCSNDKLVNIPNTLDPMSSYSYHPPLVGEVVRLVFFDRLDEHQKAVSIVPTIIQGLLAKGYSVNLDIIGDGPARKVLADSLSVSKLDNLTTFHGALQQSSAFEIIRKSHFLIKPTRFEGFPSSLLEATVNGAFPVCSNIDGVTNWI